MNEIIKKKKLVRIFINGEFKKYIPASADVHCAITAVIIPIIKSIFDKKIFDFSVKVYKLWEEILMNAN